MVEINPNILIMPLNVNSLNIQLKHRDYQSGQNKQTKDSCNYMLAIRNSF